MLHTPLIKVITPATPGLLTRLEFADYLNIDNDRVADIARRFNLETLEGHFPERAVWRQILGLEPVGEAAADLLRQQLQDINWVARRIGRKPSTIRNKIQKKTFAYSRGVQLGEVVADKASPRLRRFIPTLINTQRACTPAPDFCQIAPIPAPSAEVEMRPADQPAPSGGEAVVSVAATDTGDANNVFARMCQDNASRSGQRWK